MSERKYTSIASLGQFKFVDRLCAPFVASNSSTVKGCGDDAAVIDAGDKYLLVSTDLLLEGVQFDLTYCPLQHLGYKTVVAGISDILAMNGTPRQLTLGVGISARFSVEMIEQLYEGVRYACKEYGVDLVGGDTSASVNGLTLAVTVIGEVAKDKIVYRNGAQVNDLICVTGALGGAYMGLHLLEREKRALAGHPNPHPKFEGYEYILGRQLRPVARQDIIQELAKANLVPTSMIDITDGLASEILHLCKDSDKGARIYLNRLPIAQETHRMAEELHADPVVAALNGGDDFELLFTVPLARQEEVFALGLDVIGHITAAGTGVALVTPDDQLIPVQAPGWVTEKQDTDQQPEASDPQPHPAK